VETLRNYAGAKETAMAEVRASGEPQRGRCQRVFVVRVWQEAGALAHADVRGSVHELDSGRKFFFSGLRDLHDFLTLRLAAPDVVPPAL
jgi:hypothetical protein